MKTLLSCKNIFSLGNLADTGSFGNLADTESFGNLADTESFGKLQAFRALALNFLLPLPRPTGPATPNFLDWHF